MSTAFPVSTHIGLILTGLLTFLQRYPGRENTKFGMWYINMAMHIWWRSLPTRRPNHQRPITHIGSRISESDRPYISFIAAGTYNKIRQSTKWQRGAFLLQDFLNIKREMSKCRNTKQLYRHYNVCTKWQSDHLNNLENFLYIISQKKYIKFW